LKKELTENGLGIFIEYPGTQHGFVTRPHEEGNVIQQRDKAVQAIIDYFKQNI